MPAPTLTQRRGATVLGLIITVVCVAMSAAAAADRAGTPLDQVLYTATAAVFVAGSHVLPALSSRRPGMWLLSGLCLMATLYHLAHYLDASQARTGHARAAAAVPASAQQQALRDELAALAARPLAEVAAELAAAEAAQAKAKAALARCGEAKCGSAQAAMDAAAAKVRGLAVQADQARKADALRQQLRQHAASADSAAAAAAVDPVDAKIAAATGLPVGTVGLMSSLVQAGLLELLGVVAWTLAIRQPAPALAPAEPVAVPQRHASAAAVVTPKQRQKPAAARWPARSALPPAPVTVAPVATAAQLPGQRARAGAVPSAIRAIGGAWRRVAGTGTADEVPPWSHAAPH